MWGRIAIGFTAAVALTLFIGISISIATEIRKELMMERREACKGCRISHNVKCRWKENCKRKKYYDSGYSAGYKQGADDRCLHCRYEEAMPEGTDIKQAIDHAYSNGRRDMLEAITPMLQQACAEKYDEGRREQEIAIMGIIRKAMPDKELLEVLKLHSAIYNEAERDELYKYPLEED